jgi:outer membrane protein OmpA-like peptidoglycan-associated protein
VPQRSLTLPGITAIAGVLVAIVLGYGWWSTGQNIAALDKRTATLEGSAGTGPSLADVQKLQQDQADLGKKVDAIAVPDVAGLSSDVAALKTAVGTLTTQLGEQPQKLAALETRIAAIEAKAPADLTQVTADLAEVKTGLAALKTQIGDLAPGALATLSSKVDDLSAKLPAAPADTTQINADLAEVKSGLAALKTQIGDLGPSALASLAAQVDDLSAKLPTTAAPADDAGQVATVVAALSGQVDTLRAQLGEVSADKLASLQTKIDGLDSKVAALDPGPVTTSLGTVTTDLGAVKTQVAQLSDSVAAAASKTDLSALQTRLDEVARSVQPAADIAPLSGDIDALRTRVATLEESGSADSATVSGLKTQLDGLTARVGAVESASPAADVAALKTSLADLGTQIGTLAKGSDIATLQAAVRELQLKPAVAPTRPKILAQIYFSRGSYKLADAGTQTLASLAKDLQANPREVAIMGFTDTQGPVEFNRTLSVRRASAVRKALLGMGVDTSLVTAITGLGEDGPPMATNDDTPEQANRTVLVLAND